MYARTQHTLGVRERGLWLVTEMSYAKSVESWFRLGVSALVRLRLLRLNGTWAGYWSGRFAALLRPWPSAA